MNEILEDDNETLYEITSWYYRVLPMVIDLPENQTIDQLKHYLYMAIHDMFKIEKSIENDVTLISEEQVQQYFETLAEDDNYDDDCDCNECEECETEESLREYQKTNLN